MKRAIWAMGVVCAFGAGSLCAQDYRPPPAKPVEPAVREAIAKGTARLRSALAGLQRQGVREPVLADIAVYLKAAEWVVRHNEFYQADTAAQTVAALERGLLRASQAARGDSPWFQAVGFPVAHGYRSRIDGSVQPYVVTFPADYGKDARKNWRLDVVLHGRDTSLTEVKFLHQHDGGKPAPKEQTWVQLDIYGRGNTAYRWAGETDVLEAIDHFLAVERQFGRAELLDPARVVLRGFSMGGAGTWHLGLHRPDRWCVIGPGAGFSTTRGYWKGLPDPLPDYQEACLHIYDAVDYAENAFDVPVVAYAGSKDPQLQAARNIEARLKTLQVPMTLLVAPDLEHHFPPDWQQKAEAEYQKYAGPGKGRKEFPERVRFVTWTLKYPGCDWVEALSLDRHYHQARIDARKTADGYTLTTANVRSLRLSPSREEMPPASITVDGQEVSLGRFARPEPAQVFLQKSGAGKWSAVLPQKLLAERQRRPRKTQHLTGPIDDAFTDSFLCVRPTGDAWHAGPAKYVEGELARFRAEWGKFLRGDLPIKDDTAVTDADIATRHLILFGDPASNCLIGQALDGLPLTWTKDVLTVCGRKWDATADVPVLIYPNPLNPNRYVVLNSGHTFHAADWGGTNARLYPRLGDFAVLRPAPTEKDALAVTVQAAGLFDDDWRPPAPRNGP